MSNADDIKRNSHKIWLAGMGAYSMIKETGIDSFETLVEKGQAFEKEHNPKQSDEPNDSRLDDLKSRANQTMDRIERAFDLRVSSALSRLGISKKTDLDLLNEKVDKLTKLLEQVSSSIDK